MNPQPDDEHERPRTNNRRSRRLTILFVEDEVLIRFFAADALRDASHEVIEAANGDEAVELLSAGLVVDLLITDIRMPGNVDGMGLARFVREQHPELPILLASSHPTQEGIGPASALLLKPYTPDDLLLAVQQIAGHD
jgi:CheY-like chemotaxis protein